ncbi:MAG: VanZ family protein [Candidatus Omnitrophota bacterium]|nr:VanZ family protein [Candidatus Omnitrophota bacterium]
MRHWFAPAVWTLLIYTTVPVGRFAVNYLKANTAYALLVNVLIGLIFAVLLIVLRTRLRIRRLDTYLRLTLIIAACITAMTYVETPEEKIHFLEYGLLAFLIWRALRLQGLSRYVMAQALALSFLVGWFEEFLQWLHPGRYYDFRDVVINTVGAFIGLLITYVVWCERNLSRPERQ